MWVSSLVELCFCALAGYGHTGQGAGDPGEGTVLLLGKCRVLAFGLGGNCKGARIWL